MAATCARNIMIEKQKLLDEKAELQKKLNELEKQIYHNKATINAISNTLRENEILVTHGSNLIFDENGLFRNFEGSIDIDDEDILVDPSTFPIKKKTTQINNSNLRNECANCRRFDTIKTKYDQSGGCITGATWGIATKYCTNCNHVVASWSYHDD